MCSEWGVRRTHSLATSPSIFTNMSTSGPSVEERVKTRRRRYHEAMDARLDAAAAMVSEPHELSRPSRPTSSHSGTGHSGSGISSGHGRHTSGQQTRSGAGDDDNIMRLPAVAGADGHLRVEPPENDCALATDFFSRESLPQIVPPPPAGGGDGAGIGPGTPGIDAGTRNVRENVMRSGRRPWTAHPKDSQQIHRC